MAHFGFLGCFVFFPFLKTAQTQATLSSDSGIMTNFELSCNRDTFFIRHHTYTAGTQSKCKLKTQGWVNNGERAGTWRERRVTLSPAQFVFPSSLPNAPETWGWPPPYLVAVSGFEKPVAQRYQRCLSRREVDVILSHSCIPPNTVLRRKY